MRDIVLVVGGGIGMLFGENAGDMVEAGEVGCCGRLCGNCCSTAPSPSSMVKEGGKKLHANVKRWGGCNFPFVS